MTDAANRVKRHLTLGAAALCLAATVGCRDAKTAQRDSKGQVTKAGTASVFTLTAGDCIQPPKELSAANIQDLQAVPCTESHTHEVYAVAAYTEGDVYPGANELQAFADKSCLEQFEPYVGIPFEESSLRFSYLFPSFASWNDGKDRNVVCFIVSTAEPMTTSARGVAR